MLYVPRDFQERFTFSRSYAKNYDKYDNKTENAFQTFERDSVLIPKIKSIKIQCYNYEKLLLR